MLFGCYRRGDANDPEIYVAATAAVLSSYDLDLIREVTDPGIGIQSTEKFMTFPPNVGELKVYCEAIAARRERVRRLGEFQAPNPNQPRLDAPARAPGDLATVFVPINNSRYPELLEWSKTADPRFFKFERRPGIWVSYDTWDQRSIGVRKVSEIAKPIIEAAVPYFAYPAEAAE